MNLLHKVDILCTVDIVQPLIAMISGISELFGVSKRGCGWTTLDWVLRIKGSCRPCEMGWPPAWLRVIAFTCPWLWVLNSWHQKLQRWQGRWDCPAGKCGYRFGMKSRSILVFEMCSFGLKFEPPNVTCHRHRLIYCRLIFCSAHLPKAR